MPSDYLNRKLRSMAEAADDLERDGDVESASRLRGLAARTRAMDSSPQTGEDADKSTLTLWVLAALVAVVLVVGASVLVSKLVG